MTAEERNQGMENTSTRIIATDTITQVSILDALFASRFDGCLSCGELLTHGDLGHGTFDRMDGEMIIVDGCVYQARTDGKVYTPGPEVTTPFATVCHFRADATWTLGEPTGLDAIKQMINEKASNPNVFCAIRVDGTFSWMKTQVLPKQSKPYPPVVKVVKACPHFELKDVPGTIVGVRCPPYVRGINDPGFHLHFVSDDRTQGGHVLECVMERGTCAIDICSNHHVILPDNAAALAGLDLSRDLVKEFEDALGT
jgi:acetolactate decarboxylase